MNMWTKHISCDIIAMGVFKMKSKTICFTGHRNLKNRDKIEMNLKETLKTLIDAGYNIFLAGGALGFDELASNTVISLKTQYPEIKLVLVLPFHKQYEHEKNINENDIENYNNLISKADEIIVLNEKYKRGCYYERNKYLVDNASLCISYQRRKSGGTAYTTEYAGKQGIRIVNLGRM